MLQIRDGFLHSGPQAGFDILDGFETWTAGCCWLFCLHSEVVSKKEVRPIDYGADGFTHRQFALYATKRHFNPFGICKLLVFSPDRNDGNDQNGCATVRVRYA